MQGTLRIAVFVLALGAGVLRAQDVRAIWTETRHAAFTDLVEFRGELVCAFRESDRHVGGEDGKIRVIRSADGGETWESAALVERKGTDLRDPKLSITPDNRLMLLIGASVYDRKFLLQRGPLVAFAADLDTGFGDLGLIAIDPEVRSKDDWLWRVTWHDGVAWGVVYQPGSEGESVLRLVRSEDSIHYTLVTTLDVTGSPNETTLRFDEDGRLIALVRREGGERLGVVGVAQAPYEVWSWAELPVRLGGPDFLVLPGGDLIAGTRGYPDAEHAGVRTVLARFTTDGAWHEMLTLPSGGDTSYPGMLARGDDLLVSYYSSHEAPARIYLARVPLAELAEKESSN